MIEWLEGVYETADVVEKSRLQFRLSRSTPYVVLCWLRRPGSIAKELSGPGKITVFVTSAQRYVLLFHWF